MASVITSKVGTGTSVPLSINASNTYFKGNVIFNKSVTCNVTSTNSIFFDGTGNLYVDVGNIQFSAKDSFQLRKGYSSYSLPSKTGTIALTSDITSSIDDLKEALKPLMYSNSYDTFGKAPSGHDNYYELCVLKSASDTENGGSLLLEATLGDYGREKQGYILCQISTRDGLWMTGFRNGVGGWNSDLIITKDTDGLFHLYLLRRENMYSADNIIIKNYNSHMLVSINKYLPSPASTYTGSIVWNYGDDKNLTRIYPAVNII